VITVTRFNGSEFVLNADLIRTVEAMPDTKITLINGDHFLVRETPKEIVERVMEYGRHLRTLIPPD